LTRKIDNAKLLANPKKTRRTKHPENKLKSLKLRKEQGQDTSDSRSPEKSINNKGILMQKKVVKKPLRPKA